MAGRKKATGREINLELDLPHPKQVQFIESTKKRKLIRAGRRGGKTRGIALLAILAFLNGARVLYAAPTNEQLMAFWGHITRQLDPLIQSKKVYKNESLHLIEIPGTETRIRGKTAWNADTLRGDYAGLLILDEWQLMDESAWEEVGAPMLLDNNGNAVFIYTPPSLHSRSVSKARDKNHAAKMWDNHKNDPRWGLFHFTSLDNPALSPEGLAEVAQDMTSLAYRMEIMAEDINEAPGALWTRATLEICRVSGNIPAMERMVVGVDPSATSTGNMAGVIVAGKANGQGYVFADKSIQGSPLVWAKEAVLAYHVFKADRIIAEANQGGEMVELTIHQADPGVPVTLVHASRGKQTRAEPVAAKYEKGEVHHVGSFPELEDELCLWVPGDPSPNRMDALVWALTDLLISGSTGMLDFFAAQHAAAKAEQAKRQANA